MVLNEKICDDIKPMTKLLSGLSLLIIGAGYTSSFMGFKDGFDYFCYVSGFTGLLTSLIMYKKLKSCYENSFA
ncbi:MAG TPA: hypothetical protein VI790_03945 [Candidatus Nanoarchaeia archaeon]|nr:hypothetical protein [Candidatus Nanoarchaeia archaeon]